MDLSTISYIILITIFVQCGNIVTLWTNRTGEENDSSHRDVDVLILGAGYSGIAAATALRKHNINNFLVLDAKDYIGGRVKGESFAGVTIPIGAGWLHKIEENHINYQLALKYNLKRYTDTYHFDQISFRHGIFGYRFNKWYVKQNERIMRIGLTRCKEYAEKEKSSKMQMSFRDCLQWAGWDIHSFKNEKIREAIDFFMYDFENAGMPEHQSMWQLDYTGEGDDEIVTDPRGYAYPILQEIKPFRNRFRLNEEVVSVTRSGDNRYTVQTSDRKLFRANHVITTFSSGVLLAGKVNFNPELPEWKMKVLNKVPMGHYCKFFFRFPYQFWEDSTYIILATRVRGNYVHWQNMNRPNLFPGSNVLLCTLTGKMCKEKHAVSDKVIIEEAMKVLRIQEDYKNAPDPIEFKRNSWSTDPHVLGAYSLPSPGITPNDYKALEHPLHDSLWFTGEYANIEQFGYVHGAYEHGYKVGGRVAQCIKEGKCPGEYPI